MIIVNWTNICIAALAVFALVMVIRMHEEVAAFFAAMGDLGPEHSQDEKIWGLIVFGLVSLTLVGVLKVLMQKGE